VERLRLKTPVGGLVVVETIYRGNAQFGQVQNGDTVNPGTFFMRVVDLSKMVLSGSVNQVDVQAVRIGQKCKVRLDAYPDLVLSGHVEKMGALATTGGGSRFRRGSSGSFVKVVSVEVAIDDADKRVIPDLSGSADIVFERQENALLVPRSAIQKSDSDAIVFVRAGDQFVERPVKLGKMSSTHAIVLEGLAEGDEVALQRPPQKSDT
jgi:multidrug resistance efflux pump